MASGSRWEPEKIQTRELDLVPDLTAWDIHECVS